MVNILQIPLDGGGELLVESVDSGAGDLGLASPNGDRTFAVASQSLERSLDEITPALHTVARRLRAIAPQEYTVEFGLTLAAEAGLIVAKGSVEAHFTVTLKWKSEEHADRSSTT
ncbi:hypothetical protein ABH920_006375 [Catenulispora sp. EB89]|uniref:CU044_2847 family protein n=1 Tax=Catenulispora sp. EB89 TaxID=3156257 RepID=UPI003519A754